MRKTADDNSLCIVLATAPSHDVAASIANTLISENLVACATLGPDSTSIYRWEGKLHTEQEVQIIFKTMAEAVTKLQERFTSLSPYTVPEFIVIPAAAAHARYLEWVRNEVKLTS